MLVLYTLTLVNIPTLYKTRAVSRPACLTTQLNKNLHLVEFSKLKKGLNSLKIHFRVISLGNWSPIMDSNKCVKFKPILFSSFRDSNLHEKTLPKCKTTSTTVLPILRKVKLKTQYLYKETVKLSSFLWKKKNLKNQEIIRSLLSRKSIVSWKVNKLYYH
jgi:hypothetical protein